MIKYLLYSILVTDCVFILHQEPSSSEAIIQKILTNKVTVESRVDSLNSYAANHLKSQPKLARTFANRALELALNDDYLRGVAASEYYLGTSWSYEKFDLALEHLMKAHSIASQLNENKLLANTLLSISSVYHGMDNYKKAIETAKHAQAIALKMKDNKLLSRVHTNLATYYYTCDKISLAIEHSRIALKLKIAIKDNYGIRLNYLNLGVILTENDSTINEGIAHIKTARRLSEKDPIMINDAVTNMIWAYSQKGDYEMSLAYLDSAILGSDTIDNAFTKQAMHRLGKEVYLELGDFKNAYLQAEAEHNLEKELRGKEVEGRLKILELENENSENQRQILILERTRSEAQLNFKFAVLLAVLFLIVIGFLYYNFRMKKHLIRNLKAKQLEVEDKSHLLEIKNKEIEQFAYVASHDLKAPLNTIMSCINMLTDEIELKLDEQSKQMASFINTSANRMKSMINSLLEHGRLGAQIQFEEVDLNALVNDLLRDLQLLIQETGAIIDVNYLPRVLGSPVEISLLFQNLITNAVKFSNENQTPRISITYRSLKNIKRYQFSLKDNGVGIPEEKKEKVFNLFERAHGKEFEGSGIGLAHCKKIIDLHKGSIWIDSQIDHGTTFHFLLPMRDWNEEFKLDGNSE